MRNRSFVILLYLMLARVSAPLFRIAQSRRLSWGKEEPLRQNEQWGKARHARPKEGRLVWFHAASIGETQSILGIVEQLLAQDEQLHVLITSVTLSSANLLEQSMHDRFMHQFAPYDCYTSVCRFLDHWRPDLAIWVESELWPQLICETRHRAIPMALINCRISENTSRRWQRWPKAMFRLLNAFDAILVQSENTLKQIAELGVANEKLTLSGSTKEDAGLPKADPTELKVMQAEKGDRYMWLASSTHPGEDAALIEAHMSAFGAGEALMIIAPRHPERGAEIAELARARGLKVALRSAADSFNTDADADIYIADTLGEMGLWYRLVDAAFIAGSLSDHGGHNPYEPALLDCPIIHGPIDYNFKEIYARLHADQGAIVAKTSDEIAAALIALQDPERRVQLARNARACLRTSGAATSLTTQKITQLLERG